MYISTHSTNDFLIGSSYLTCTYPPTQLIIFTIFTHSSRKTCILITLSLSHMQVFLGAFFNLFGAVLRYISTVHPILCSSIYDKSGFMVAMIGQIISSFAQPFLLYAPTKLANTWFGSKERGLCTNLASVGK